MNEPQWKLKVRQVRRWYDLWSLLGWRWQWEVRKWFGGPGRREGGYYLADLFGAHGRARTYDGATVAVEHAYERFAAPVLKEPWEVWYHE